MERIKMAKENKEQEELMNDQWLVDYVIEAKKRGREFQDNFREKADQCVEHYNCTKPEAWKKKEKWQSQIYIPQAYKNVEVGASMLVKMLLSQKDFFEITGFDPDEHDLREGLSDFIVHVLQKANFYNIAALGIKEACITSTCFMKMLDVSEGPEDFTINVIPRTFYDVMIDPSISTYWVNARFKVDDYEKDVSEIITSKLYKYGKQYFEEIKDSSMRSEQKMQREALDKQTQTSQDVTYEPHVLSEFVGMVKNPDTKEDEYMFLSVVDDKWLVRKDKIDKEEDPYDVIRVNPIPKQFYGTGLIEKNLDIENLMNGTINLWFDNWKLAVMKMLHVDPTGDVQWETIKIGPAQVLKAAKGAITPIEFGVPVDGMGALGILDQIAQEVTGITKTAQGQSTPATDETLGEVELKLARSDARFLQTAKFIEAEYLGRFLKKLAKYIVEKAPQKYVDKIMGHKIVTRSFLGIKRQIKTKRLDLDFIRKNKKDVTLDFQPIGISRFANKAEDQARHERLLKGVLENDTLGTLTDVQKLYKRTLQVMGFENLDFLRTEDELDDQINNLEGRPQQGAGASGAPVPAPPPTEGAV